MEALQYPNEYGECARDDIELLVRFLDEFCIRRDTSLVMSHTRLTRSILEYIALRQRYMRIKISNPRSRIRRPAGWTVRQEEVWFYWLDSECGADAFHDEVLYPVFGRHTRLWEANCESWRDEIRGFFPWWIVRSKAIVNAIDPPLQSDVFELCRTKKVVKEEHGDKTKQQTSGPALVLVPVPEKAIDPFLLEYGTNKQIKLAKG